VSKNATLVETKRVGMVIGKGDMKREGEIKSGSEMGCHQGGETGHDSSVCEAVRYLIVCSPSRVDRRKATQGR